MDQVNIQHKELAAGRWQKMRFVEQMANIGSEVERALNWQKRNQEYSQKAFERALELLDLTLSSAKSYPRLRELARVREVLVDYFFGNNEYQSNEQMWRSYFFAFTMAVRKDY